MYVYEDFHKYTNREKEIEELKCCLVDCIFYPDYDFFFPQFTPSNCVCKANYYRRKGCLSENSPTSHQVKMSRAGTLLLTLADCSQVSPHMRRDSQASCTTSRTYNVVALFLYILRYGCRLAYIHKSQIKSFEIFAIFSLYCTFLFNLILSPI